MLHTLHRLTYCRLASQRAFATVLNYLLQATTSFIHSTSSVTTYPQPLPKRVLHTERSSAS